MKRNKLKTAMVWTFVVILIIVFIFFSMSCIWILLTKYTYKQFNQVLCLCIKNAGGYSVLLVGIVVTIFFQIYSKEKEIEDELNRLNATIINAVDKAKELGNSKVMNIILLGALVKSMSLEDIDWESIIRENIKEKFVDINLQAFKKGMEMVSEEAFPLKSN